jgi:hypothetical protein
MRNQETHLLTLGTEDVRPSIQQAGIASLWPLATVEGADTHYICMKSTYYEYEVDGVPKLWSAARSKIQVRNKRITYFHHCAVGPSIYQVGVAHMTSGHNRRCWHAWYMYEVYLLWLWSGWGASIIINTCYKWETKRISYYHHCDIYIRLALHPHTH